MEKFYVFMFKFMFDFFICDFSNDKSMKNYVICLVI